MPLVSVVIPVCNAQKYLRECLDSILNQTLTDIELICVDDGSKDESGAILDEYARRDHRIHVIYKENTGYGHSMNVGFDAAQGEYIGIVESDDWIERDMYERLFEAAVLTKADVVKCNFFFYYGAGVHRDEFFGVIPSRLCGCVFRPLDDVNLEKIEFWNGKPSIWSSIYRRDFIRENMIRFNETPGASYQDASFNFKVWACANRVFCLERAMLHYRQDNTASSINTFTSKVYCVRDEYEEMERFISSLGRDQKKLTYIMNRLRFDTYMWNINRLASPMKEEFAAYAGETFRKLQRDGDLDASMFWPKRWQYLQRFSADYRRALSSPPAKKKAKMMFMKVRNWITTLLDNWTRFYPERGANT